MTRAENFTEKEYKYINSAFNMLLDSIARMRDSLIDQLKIQTKNSEYYEVFKLQEEFSEAHEDSVGQTIGYVVVVQSTKYLSNIPEIYCDDISKATLYKGITKNEVIAIAKEALKNCRCMWSISRYDIALKEYDKRIYVDETKTMKWSEYIDIQDAIRLVQEGNIVGYTIDGDVHFLRPGDVPENLPISTILNAKWRSIEILK
jgi:hypothetical protein